MKVCPGLKDDYKRMMSLGPDTYAQFKDNHRREMEAGVIVWVCLMLGVILMVISLIVY